MRPTFCDLAGWASGFAQEGYAGQGKSLFASTVKIECWYLGFYRVQGKGKIGFI
jgi:hypothetical protein